MAKPDPLIIFENIDGGMNATAAQLKQYIMDSLGFEMPDSSTKLELWTKVFGKKADIPEEVIKAVEERAELSRQRSSGKKVDIPNGVELNVDEGRKLYREYMLMEPDEKPRWLATLTTEQRVYMIFGSPDILITRQILQRIEEVQPILATEMFEKMSFQQRRESYTGHRTAQGQVAPDRVQIKIAEDPKDKYPVQLACQGVLTLVKRGDVVAITWGAYNSLKNGSQLLSIATGEKDDHQMPIYEFKATPTYPYQVLGMIMPDGFGFKDQSYIPEEESLEPTLVDVL